MTGGGAARLLWVGLAGVALLCLLGVGTSTILQATVIGLACVALVPIAGWLRVLSFLPLAAAGVAAITAAVLLNAHQAVPVVAGGAGAAGALTGLVIMAIATGDGGADGVTSVVAAVAVWGLALPTVSVSGANEVVLFGIDLSSDRALALVALGLLAGAAWATLQAGESAFARGAIVAAADPRTARRFGLDLRRTRMEAGLLSGAVGGFAGLVLALDAQTLPAVGALAPAVGLTWLGAVLVGGRTTVPSALLGAALVGIVAPTAGVPAPAAAGLGLALVAATRRDGLIAMLGPARRAL